MQRDLKSVTSSLYDFIDKVLSILNGFFVSLCKSAAVKAITTVRATSERKENHK